MTRTARPFFSVVVPTRNRSSLLKFALTSVVNQTDLDVELIVSDNWSTDDTPNVARSVGEPLDVKVVRPPRPLPMAENWNFALSHATGQWVLLLGDDDYFCRDLLATVRSAAEASDTRVITWYVAFYHHNVELPESEMKYVPFGFDPSKINMLDMWSWTGESYEIDARRQLTKLYGFEEIVCPTGHVSALRRDLIDDVVAWAGTLFHSPYPDFGCAAAVLATADSMTHIDLPLHVLGRVPRLGKFSYLLSKEKQTDFSEALAAEYEAGELFEGQPVQSPRLMTTNIAATLLRVRRLMPTSSARIEFDWARYLMKCQWEIVAMAEADIDVSDVSALYEEAVARQPSSVRGKLGLRFPALSKRALQLKSTEAAHRLRRVLYRWRIQSSTFADRGELPRWRVIVKGRDEGFVDISEAADHVDRLRAEGALLASARRNR